MYLCRSGASVIADGLKGCLAAQQALQKLPQRDPARPSDTVGTNPVAESTADVVLDLVEATSTETGHRCVVSAMGNTPGAFEGLLRILKVTFLCEEVVYSCHSRIAAAV